MKILISELLVRLAEKEEESKELVAQVEALEIVVTALLRKLDGDHLRQITDSVSTAMKLASDEHATPGTDASLLENYIQRLLFHPRH
ncbi:anti-adapter protein IraP [Erwinia tasmaniensis]|uniref:anti-adapter protein IraP n=1 Tax=Erwinia tasmaniensis TaxID=338565 RepID=UPI003A4DCE20